MARGYKRLSFRARHLLRQLGKAKNVTLQRLNLHELRHAISRKHGFKGPKKTPGLGTPGLYQRLSGKARHLMRRLRHSRTWQVQKQTVNELEREIERGARIAQAREARRTRRAERAERTAKRAVQRGRQFRAWAQRKQEPALARAERRQAGRKNPAPRGTLRQRFGPGRARGIWQQWRYERTTPRDHAWERSRYNAQSPRYRPLPERRRNAGRGPRPVPARRRTPRAPRAPRPARTR